MHLVISTPFDAHAHLREGAVLRAVAPCAARQFGRVIAMPNLRQPITTTEKAVAYRQAIRTAVPAETAFEPLMTVYLTDDTDPDDLAQGHAEGALIAAKLYPANATTNSGQGVTDIRRIYPVLERMQKIGLVLSVHGEVGDPAVDIFDREKVFLERALIPLRRDFPELRIVMEHLSTREAVEYVRTEGRQGKLAATITAHHLRINRNALFAGGFRPHNYCLPIVKEESDRRALVAAATSGAPMFFLGTDSAPHPRSAKESAQGAAGIFTHLNALSLYVDVFEKTSALGNFAAFASLNGPAFYGKPPASTTLELTRADQPLADVKPILTEGGAEEIVPFLDDSPLHWRMSTVL